MMNQRFKTSPIQAALGALLCGVCAVATGCSNSQFLSTPDNSPLLVAGLQGKVHGGQQPISGASVQLWGVGSGSYGAAAAKIGSSVSTDSNGNFSLGTYTCPTGTTLTYITASGGNAGGGTNSNIMLAAALGQCSTLGSSTFIFMNEVTTAAAAFALGQYFTPAVGGLSTADSFGAPTSTQAQTGIANAFATVNNLVCGVSTNTVCTSATGNAVTSATLTGTAGTVTMTPESAKLYTVADVLAACVNSGATGYPSGQCATLFADVTPTGGVTPTDTLQAAVYMSLNPTSNNATGSSANLGALYGLITGTSPYVGVATQPTDWTIGIQYTSATPLNDPQNMAADAGGNIWVINHNGTSTGSLTELSPVGTPLVNVSTIGGQSINALQPRNEAIDTNGNVWTTASTSPAQVVEYNAATPGSSVALADPTNKGAYGIAIDGSNNVFYTHESGSSTFSVMEFLGGTLATTSLVEYPVYSPGGTIQQPEFAAIDPSGNLWMTNGSSTAGLFNNMFQMSGYNGSTACTVFPCNVASDPTLTETYTNMVSATGGVPTLSEPWAIAAGKAGTGVWTGNVTGNTVTNMTSTTAGNNYGSATSLNKPQYVAVDGVGNVWVTNGATATNGSVTEFMGTGTGVGTILSPVNTGTAPFTAIGFVHPGIMTAEGVAIDPSGNIWIASQVAATGGVFEIVGAAAPTVTPIALALKNSAIGAKP